MTLNTLHAYRNTRPTIDWNTCGQAAIATILDFHGIDPFGLPRDSSGYWNDGEIIDALINDGMGPDVLFGWGTDAGRLEEALGKYGLDAHASYQNPVLCARDRRCSRIWRHFLTKTYPCLCLSTSAC